MEIPTYGEVGIKIDPEAVANMQNTMEIPTYGEVGIKIDPEAMVNMQNTMEIPTYGEVRGINQGTITERPVTGTDYEGISNVDLMNKEELHLYNLQKYKERRKKERSGKTIFGKKLDFGSGFYNSKFLKDVKNLNITGKVKSGLESLIAGTEIAKQEIVQPTVEKLSQASQYFGQGEFSVNPEYPEVPNQIFQKEIIEKRMKEIRESAKNNLISFDTFFDKPILPSKDKIKSIMNKKDSTIAIENLYRDLSIKGGDIKNNSIMQLEKLTTKFSNKEEIEKELKDSNKIIEQNNKIIDKSGSSINQKIEKSGNQLIRKAYGVANKQEEINNNPDKSKTDLDKAQDKYLDALKLYNTNLDNKNDLINKSQTESFWAFVARVGANISKGTPIAESLATELPQAMKDRKSLTQAKSDLQDKKQLGQVNLAKAEMTIETADAAAAAKASESQKERDLRIRLEEIKAANKPNYYKGNWKENEYLIKRNIDNISDRILNAPPDKKLQFIKSAPGITGVTPENFDAAFADFKNKIHNQEIFAMMKQHPNYGNLSGPELAKQIYFDLWKNSKGTFRKGTLMGWEVPKIFPGTQMKLFND